MMEKMYAGVRAWGAVDLLIGMYDFAMRAQRDARRTRRG